MRQFSRNHSITKDALHEYIEENGDELPSMILIMKYSGASTSNEPLEEESESESQMVMDDTVSTKT